MLKTSELEKELREWREAKARKQGAGARPMSQGARPISNDRRTVRVNGQEVVVVTKPKRPIG